MSRRISDRPLGVTLAVVLLLGFGTRKASAGAPAIGAPQAFSGSVQLASIACTDADTCYVIGGGESPAQGTLFTLTDGTVTNQRPLGPAGSGGWKDIACGSDRTCVAIGLDSERPPHTLILPIVNGTPGAAQALPSGTYLGAGVSAGAACGSGGVCYGVGGGSATSATTGVIVRVAGEQAGKPLPVAGTQYLFDIDCPTPSTCFAIGGSGIVSISDGSGGSVQAIQPPSNGSPNLTAIACPDAHTCYSSGAVAFDPSFRGRGTNLGAVVASLDGQPGPIQTVSGTDWLYAVVCPTSRLCFALGTGNGGIVGGALQGVVVPIADGVIGATMTVDVGAGSGQPGFVSGDCPSSTTCYALSASGIVPITLPGP